MPSPKSHPQPPTSVHHTPPSAESDSDAKTGAEQTSQAETLRHNTEGGQAQSHPDAPAGQHATGSFTGSSKKNSEKRKSA